MREKDRNPIERVNKFPQFITMNVIDGQAGLIIYFSLILCSLTINNILNIIVLLILAGVTIATLTGDSGILSNADKAKEQTNIANSKEQIELAIQGALTEGLGTINKTDLETELNKLIGENKYIIEPDNEEGPWSVTITGSGYKATITKTGKTENPQTLPTGAGTTPWLPEGFSKVVGTDLSTGLVIANTTTGLPGTQNYVWIEVPRAISASITRNGTATTVTLADAQNDSEICAILEAYAGAYTKGKSNQNNTSWKEEWYDFYNATWDGESEYAYIGVSTTAANAISSNYPFDKWEEYYGGEVYTSTSKNVTGTMTKVDFTTATYDATAYYFTKVNDAFKNHDDGCGMTYSQYQTAYSSMLNSIKKNGGFWLAQYEAGIAPEAVHGTNTTNRKSHTAITVTKANYAKDQYTYNWIYCSEAQKIANTDSTSEYTSSLPFGIQWDLVCRFLEEKTDLTYEDIATTSTWGNYQDTLYKPSKTAKYSTNGTKFNLVYVNDETAQYEKTAEGNVLLTTGAIEATTASADTSPMNIYDFAGNVWEWTLEHTAYAYNPCAYRGGSYNYSSTYPASYRNFDSTTISYSYNYGFRSVLY